MRCPQCLGPTHVRDTRPVGDMAVRRRRECLRCNHRFSTHERKAVEQLPLPPRVAA
jgi:transcriptional repressor NrdR